MGIFKDAIARTAQEEIGLSPSADIGVLVQTSDVIKTELKNPWLMAIDRMSQADEDKVLKLDAQFTGWSLVSARKGVSREPQVFVNPRMVGAYGGTSGKDIAPEPGMLADTTSIKSQTPTVLSITKRSPGSTATPLPTDKGNANFGGLSGSLPDGNVPYNPMQSGVQMTPDKVGGEVGSALPKYKSFTKSLESDTDPKTGQPKPTNYKDTSPQGDRISTGAYLIDNTSVCYISNSIFEGIDSLW